MHKKRAIVTYGVGGHAELLKLSLPTFERYAALHGYDLHVVSCECDGRPPAWGKIPALQKLLKTHDEVLWLDADVLIVSPEEDLASLVPETSLQALTVHVNKRRSVGPNTGVWLVRPDLDKWSSNTWPIYGAVPYAHRKALVMGWNERLEKKLGKPPAWATCLKPQEISTQEFLSRCHVLLAINGGARENWPRVGLEAMAAGVPLAVQNQWGWREMVRHGVTGFLCDNDQELAYYTAHLAYDERKRLMMAEAARTHVERLADPETILAGWRQLFDFLGITRRQAA